jgi:hypothetical protein
MFTQAAALRCFLDVWISGRNNASSAKVNYSIISKELSSQNNRTCLSKMQKHFEHWTERRNINAIGMNSAPMVMRRCWRIKAVYWQSFLNWVQLSRKLSHSSLLFSGWNMTQIALEPDMAKTIRGERVLKHHATLWAADQNRNFKWIGSASILVVGLFKLFMGSTTCRTILIV